MGHDVEVLLGEVSKLRLVAYALGAHIRHGLGEM